MPETIYTPSGIIDILNNTVRIPQELDIIHIKGTYEKNTDRLYAGQFYDSLVDETGGSKLAIKVTQLQRNLLSNGDLATVVGVLNRKIRNDSTIAVSLNVTDVIVVEEQTITTDDRKRAEIQLRKLEIGYKVPELIIKQKLYREERPEIALVFAEGTIVEAEFENALAYAGEFIDFKRRRIAFGNTNSVINSLRAIASENEIIALIRGGGITTGIDFFNSTDFNEAILNINACFISAIGHRDEDFFFKNIADKVIDTPTALGYYFRDIVNEVRSEITNSQALLTAQVQRQFQSQINTLSQQVTTLNSQLGTINHQNSALTTQVQNLVTNNQTLRDQSNRMSNELLQANNNLAPLKSQIKKLNKNLSNRNKIIWIMIAAFILAIILFFNIV